MTDEHHTYADRVTESKTFKRTATVLVVLTAVYFVTLLSMPFTGPIVLGLSPEASMYLGWSLFGWVLLAVGIVGFAIIGIVVADAIREWG